MSTHDNEPPKCPDFFRNVCFIISYLTYLEDFFKDFKLYTFFNNLFF